MPPQPQKHLNSGVLPCLPVVALQKRGLIGILAVLLMLPSMFADPVFYPQQKQFDVHVLPLATDVEVGQWGEYNITVVNNNRSLNQEKRGTERAYAGYSGNSDEVWHFLDVDLAKVAQSIGCFGIRVERPGQLQSALEQAFAAGKPAVVDVVADIEGIAPPAWGG